MTRTRVSLLLRDEAMLKGSGVPQGLVGKKGKRKQKSKDNSNSKIQKKTQLPHHHLDIAC